MKVILASRSPRRRRLLRELGLEFKVVPSEIDEGKVTDENPAERVRKLAMLKAATVAKGMREHVLVIGADTLVCIGNEVLGKPKTRGEAVGMLTRLSGREHMVLTGICLVNTKTGNVYTDVQKTKVRFRQLTQKEIDKHAGEALDGAGAYFVQEQPALVCSIDGSYTNVVGLPVERLIPLLRENGVDI